MKLSSLRLKNWKAFADLELTLHHGDFGRNVTIIEGNNGYGKTSLLEALVFCLYGRQGLPLVGRAKARGRPDIGYDTFIERALNRDARGNDATMLVELAFDLAAGDRFVIQRSWYFRAAGTHQRNDEEVRIWMGPDEDIVQLPTGDDRALEVRGLVEQQLLPLRLAPFLLFDGEHLDRLAGNDLDMQVRLGLESALGVPLLRTLIDDLTTYARERRRSLKTVFSGRHNEIVQTLRHLEAQEKAHVNALGEIGAELDPLREERDLTVQRIGNLRGDSYATFKQLFEQRERLDRTRDGLQEQLRQKLSFDLALALAGPDLRAATRRRLTVEGELQQREAADTAGNDRYRRLMEGLGSDVERAALGMDLAQWKQIEARASAIWDRLRGDDATGDNSKRRHSYLGDADRLMVDARLLEVEALTDDAIATLVSDVEAADRELATIDEQIAKQRGADAESQRLAEALRDVQQQIGLLEERSREIGRMLASVRAELATTRGNLTRLQSELTASAPKLRRADLADRSAAAVETLIERLIPLNLDALSRAVTLAYRAMAHKQVVEAVNIAADGSVSLLDRDGTDVRAFDVSAGENQVFAFALMAAIGMISSSFPFIMDTPLARLDPEHRQNVLGFFAGLDRQIILLAQPAELSPGDRTSLDDHLGSVICLHHETGRSSARMIASEEGERRLAS